MIVPPKINIKSLMEDVPKSYYKHRVQKCTIVCWPNGNAGFAQSEAKLAVNKNMRQSLHENKG